MSFSPVLAQSVDHDEHSVSTSFLLCWAADRGRGLGGAPAHCAGPAFVLGQCPAPGGAGLIRWPEGDHLDPALGAVAGQHPGIRPAPPPAGSLGFCPLLPSRAPQVAVRLSKVVQAGPSELRLQDCWPCQVSHR